MRCEQKSRRRGLLSADSVGESVKNGPSDNLRARQIDGSQTRSLVNYVRGGKLLKPHPIAFCKNK